MKKSVLITVLTVLALSAAAVLAQPSASTDIQSQAKMSESNLNEFDAQMAKAQENMKKMQEQMDKISQTKDPREQQRLLQEHWTSMQSNVQVMRDMWSSGGWTGCCMGCAGMGYPMMMGQRGISTPSANPTPDSIHRQQMMDRFSGMQQLMMDQMRQHQQYQHMGSR